jgi:hypothetical protein
MCLCLWSTCGHDLSMRASEDLAGRVEVWLLAGLSVEWRPGVGAWLHNLWRDHWDDVGEVRRAWWFWSFPCWLLGLKPWWVGLLWHCGLARACVAYLVELLLLTSKRRSCEEGVGCGRGATGVVCWHVTMRCWRAISCSVAWLSCSRYSFLRFLPSSKPCRPLWYADCRQRLDYRAQTLGCLHSNALVE